MSKIIGILFSLDKAVYGGIVAKCTSLGAVFGLTPLEGALIWFMICWFIYHTAREIAAGRDPFPKKDVNRQ